MFTNKPLLQVHRVPQCAKHAALLLAVGLAACDGMTDPHGSASDPTPSGNTPTPGSNLPAGLQGRIAFAGGIDGDRREIFAINADGSGLTRLTTSPGLDEAPAWSPDGGRIAFISDRDGAPRIYTMAADGSDVRRRTQSRIYGFSGYEPIGLAWSPDGSAIAFAAPHNGSAAIATVGVIDERIDVLFDYPGYDVHPSWSPDGRLAFASDYEAYDFVLNIYTLDRDGTAPRLITEGFGFHSELPYYVHPTWSPDGSMIAFVRGTLINVVPGREREYSEQDMRFTVAVMSADGAFVEDLAWAGDIPWTETLDPGSLTWSPDGRGIAYTHVDCDLLFRTGCSNIRSVRYVSLDGGQEGTLVAYGRNPSWRP